MPADTPTRYPHIGLFDSRELAEAGLPSWSEGHEDENLRVVPLLAHPGKFTLEYDPQGPLSPTGYSWIYPFKPQPVDTAAANRFRVIEAAEFAGGPVVDPDWMVDELIPACGLGMTFGASGEGKTHFMVDLACAINRGVNYRARRVRQKRTVIVVAEGEHFFPLKLKAYAQCHGVPLSDLPAVIPAAPNLFKSGDVTQLIAALREKGAGYVLIDPLAQCAVGAEESSAKDMGVVLAACKRLQTELGAFVHLVHHIGKDATRGPRGSSAFKPAVDCLLHLEGDGVRGTVTVEKLKDGAGGARFGFELEFVKLGVSTTTGRPFGSLVVRHTEAAVRKSGRRMAPNKGAVFAAWADLARVGPVREQALIPAAVARLKKPDGKRDQRPTHTRTALKALLRDRVLFEHPDGTLHDTSATIVSIEELENLN